MLLIDELEYAGRCELAEAVLWAIEHAAGSDQPTPAGVSVAGLQHLLDQRLARVERHLVFTEASRLARAKTKPCWLPKGARTGQPTTGPKKPARTSSRWAFP
ncbi:MAG: hypothetical protein KTV68_14875 [Acidimicrobiia bacterium]|nr:hypothetical protein [Acidimicrobiia bacterium]